MNKKNKTIKLRSKNLMPDKTSYSLDKSIHDFDLNMICEYYSNVERQGPGNPEVTLKALSFIEGLTEKSRIADIGCGTGGQTITLAQNTKGNIIGVDFFPGFINLFNQNAQSLNLQDRVKGIVSDMKNLPFQEKEFDLIWSEGAIYNIGFEQGLNEWRKFLKSGGYIAVSEMSWFTEERPAEIQEFMQQVEPGTDIISTKVAQMQKAGYIPLATFVLPENCWTEHFFAPQVAAQEAFLKKHAGNKTAEEFIAGERHHKTLYDKYKAYYGYVFYIGKKI
jgi:ubiquinone/menaquinone biosynthesis C-methylase UbiE